MRVRVRNSHKSREKKVKKYLIFDPKERRVSLHRKTWVEKEEMKKASPWPKVEGPDIELPKAPTWLLGPGRMRSPGHEKEGDG